MIRFKVRNFKYPWSVLPASPDTQFMKGDEGGDGEFQY